MRKLTALSVGCALLQYIEEIGHCRHSGLDVTRNVVAITYFYKYADPNADVDLLSVKEVCDNIDLLEIHHDPEVDYTALRVEILINS